MPYGARFRNGAGAVVLGPNDRITRIVGTFTVTTANTGTFTDSRLVGGTAWCLPLGTLNGAVVTFNSATGTFSWDWNSIPATYRGNLVHRYGLY